MKLSFGLFMTICALLILAISTAAAPVPAALPQTMPQTQTAQTGQQKTGGAAASPPQKSYDGPYIPLPNPGEPLLSYLDRLLSGLPLLGNLLAGLGYVLFGQQIGVSSGPSVATGAAVVNHSVNNNGWVADATLFVSSENSGPRVVSNVAGGRFDDVNINRTAGDNLITNPTVISVSGNSGAVSNGDKNIIGATQNSSTAPVSVVKRGSYEKGNDYSSSTAAPAAPSTPAYHPAPPAESKPQVVETPKYSPTLPAVETPKYTPSVSVVESTPYSSALPVITPYISSSTSSSAVVVTTATYVAPPVVSSTPISVSATGYKKSGY
ncbi:hypothetical protein H4R99_000930 [Coemansia sp. RSA 1722]|nr:hypothetical protein H4R99_000930 [Coemansia sp. RSA 1722]KAJ2638970.1 hypothetical protein GGF40_001227 [Coemansia sp. RSA 1286]